MRLTRFGVSQRSTLVGVLTLLALGATSVDAQLAIRRSDEKVLSCTGGFAEVLGDAVSILATAAEQAAIGCESFGSEPKSRLKSSWIIVCSVIDSTNASSCSRVGSSP